MIAKFERKFTKAARVKYKLMRCVKFQFGADLISKSKILKFAPHGLHKLSSDLDYLIMRRNSLFMNSAKFCYNTGEIFLKDRYVAFFARCYFTDFNRAKSVR